MTFERMQQAEQIVREVLQELRPRLVAAWGKDEYLLKADESVVTELDILVEKRLREALAEFDGSIGFGGEESGLDNDQKRFWLVDPIDGTEQFTRGIRGCVNQLALINDGQPIMSIVYDFIGDEWYAAFAGKGAFCNGLPIHVSHRPINRAWIDAYVNPVSTPHIIERLRLLPSTLTHTIEGARFVATGKIEGYVVQNGKGGPWDYAPRVLLMQEAGARVAHLNGSAYNYRDPNFIAAAPTVFDELFACLHSINNAA